MRPEKPKDERRKHERFDCELEAACGPAAAGDGNVWEGKAVEISRGGIRVLASRRFEAGSILRIRVQRNAGSTITTLLARVVHVHRNDDGRWCMGCCLASEFDDDDLHSLLRKEGRANGPAD
jgi:hypothetical protein